MPYIVKDAPKPEKRMKGKCKWPFAQLEPGESFMVPNKDKMPPAEKLEDATTLANMHVAVSRQNKREPDKKFICALAVGQPHWVQVYRES